jgi:hypothetical protein
VFLKSFLHLQNATETNISITFCKGKTMSFKVAIVGCKKIADAHAIA